MSAAASIFGALAGLGDTGNQLGEARRYNQAELVKKLALAQQNRQFNLTQQEATQRMADAKIRTQREQQLITQGKQKQMVGTPFVSGGKQYARFQDPTTGALSVQELPGGTAETPEETMHRGLVAIGIPEQDASQAVMQKYKGKTAEHREVQPDPNSPTHYSAVYSDGEGNELWRTQTVPPRFLTPTETTGTSVDPYGLITQHTSIRRPLLNMGAGLAPQPAGRPTPPADDGQGVESWIDHPTGMEGLPQADTATRPDAPKSGDKPAAATDAAPSGGMSVGTYEGLDANGAIPAKSGVNPLILQFANDILAGRDVQKIPPRVRPSAEALATKYGWKGQGSLTPAQQMQIEQVDNSLKALSDPRLLKLFDSTLGKLYMSTVPLDPSSEGGMASVMAGLKRSGMSKDQAEYLDTLTRLRGVIGGIRSFTGANNSNATADRLLAELPNFTNTKDSTDAKMKIDRLRQEISIIKKLGYFRPDTGSPAGAGPAPASGGVVPPPGAVIRDFTEVGR